MLKKLLMVAAITLSFAGASSAATILVNGGSYSIGGGDEFAGVVVAGGGAGSWQVEFDATADPLEATALATIGPISFGTFTDLVISWLRADLSVITTAILGVGETTLGTTFSAMGGTDPQLLTLTWSDSQAGAGFDVEVSAVPLPAGGLLLFSALGGVAALRRRRKAA